MNAGDRDPEHGLQTASQEAATGSPDTSTLGVLFGLLYRASRREVVGLSVLGWLRLLLLAVLLLSWVLGWPIFWFGLAFVFLVALQISDWVARQAGYIVFRPTAGEAKPQAGPRLPVEQQVGCWASGPFSLSHQEMQLVMRPAKVWRNAKDELTIMVRRPSGHYAYQFVQPRTLEMIRPGWLQHGRRQQPALAITFQSTWGPGFDNPGRAYYYDPGEPAAPTANRRTIFLSFSSEQALNAVWLSVAQAGDPS
ncbi:MAG: hypothetical protein R3300_03005 [Candidatus Promineifilaceae bacterium]|nr:hypothetical protein [Candidatus Promineifilaceae bacterium]